MSKYYMKCDDSREVRHFKGLLYTILGYRAKGQRSILG